MECKICKVQITNDREQGVSFFVVDDEIVCVECNETNTDIGFQYNCPDCQKVISLPRVDPEVGRWEDLIYNIYQDLENNKELCWECK